MMRNTTRSLRDDETGLFSSQHVSLIFFGRYDVESKNSVQGRKCKDCWVGTTCFCFCKARQHCNVDCFEVMSP